MPICLIYKSNNNVYVKIMSKEFDIRIITVYTNTLNTIIFTNNSIILIFNVESHHWERSHHARYVTLIERAVSMEVTR